MKEFLSNIGLSQFLLSAITVFRGSQSNAEIFYSLKEI